MSYRLRKKILEWIAIAACWIVALLIFFPIIWMFLTSLKTEGGAVSLPPSALPAPGFVIEAVATAALPEWLAWMKTALFEPTFGSYQTVFEREGYFRFLTNSLIISFGSTALAMAIAIPSAYAMAFAGGPGTRGILLWMLSTKMLPAVGVLMPIYLIAQSFKLLDTHILLIVIYALMNLPIIMLILYNFFKEIPSEILEAGRIDGATTWEELVKIVLPLAWGGLASTALLSIVLAWNEAFWSVLLTTTKAAPLTTFIAGYTAPEGLFWAKVSAASTLAVAPILVFGWLTQRQLVQGLTFGAVK